MLTISCIYFVYRTFFSLQLFPTLSSAAPLTWPFPPQAASKAGARLTCWPSPLRGPSPVTRVSTPSGTKAACFRESDVRESPTSCETFQRFHLMLVFLSLLYSKLPKRVKSFFTDGVSPHALSLLLPPLLQRLENSPFPPFKPVLAVPGEPAGPGRGPVQAPLHLRTGNHHLQRRTQGGLAALQADPHREGKGTTLQRTCSFHGRR